MLPVVSQKSLLALTIYGIIVLVDKAAVQDPIYPIGEDLRNQPDGEKCAWSRRAGCPYIRVYRRSSVDKSFKEVSFSAEYFTSFCLRQKSTFRYRIFTPTVLQSGVDPLSSCEHILDNDFCENYDTGG
jgi:hypothetical protein